MPRRCLIAGALMYECGYKSSKFGAPRRLQLPLNNPAALTHGKSPSLGEGAVAMFLFEQLTFMDLQYMHVSGTGKELSCRASFISGHDNITIIQYVTTELAQTTSGNRWQRNVPVQAHRQD
jgi:hypothetical protein